MHLPATVTAPLPALASSPEDAPELRVGAADLGAKESLLLRSLIRLLDLRIGLRLQFSEDTAHCNVLFVAGDSERRWPASCVIVRLLPAGGEAAGPGLRVHTPLRTSNVTTALLAAGHLLASGGATPPPCNGLAALFQVLTRHLRARDRRSTVLPLDDGHAVLVDFGAESVRTTMDLDALLAGRYQPRPARRATPSDVAQASGESVLPLRGLVWAAAQALGDAGTEGALLQGRYRLLRWPESTALSRPGLPRLVALWTTRPMSLAEAGAASDASPARVRWFLEACLALGLAIPDDAALTAVDIELPPAPVRGLLGRLRERLKLW